MYNSVYKSLPEMEKFFAEFVILMLRGNMLLIRISKKNMIIIKGLEIFMTSYLKLSFVKLIVATANLILRKGVFNFLDQQ